MKLTFVFLVVTGIIFHLKFSEPRQSFLPQAIHQVIEQHYVKNSVKFEIFYNSDNLDVLRKILKMIKELKDYQITEVDDDDETFVDVLHSGIFIFDTLDNFMKLMPRLLSADNGPEQNNFLIYCQHLTTERLGEIKKLQFFSFLVEANEEIVLKAGSLFDPSGCRQPKLIDVNKFSRKSMKWSGKIFFLTMIRDFHGCPLNFGVDPINILKDGTIFNAELFFTLASHLNFKVEQVRKKLKTTGQKIDHDVGAISNYGYNNYKHNCDLSTPLYSASLVVAVPPGAPYTPIETFFLPFDLETWILLSLVFILAFSVVFVVKLSRSRSFRVLIVGENVSMPGLNIFGIFMGIGMMTLPRRSISRIFLMNFILFSLIMRTAYQGKFFEFMTKETNKRAIQTVTELIEKNYTLYVYENHNYENNKDTYKDNLGRLIFIEVNRSELLLNVYKALQDRNFKGCVLDVSLNFELYEKLNTSMKFNLLRKEMVSYNYGVCFKRFSFMSPIFRQKIEQLVTGGVWEKMQSWRDHILKIAAKKPQPKPYDTVLTLKHLSIGFYIWLLMCLLSTLAFIGEILKFWGPKVARMLSFITF